MGKRNSSASRHNQGGQHHTPGSQHRATSGPPPRRTAPWAPSGADLAYGRVAHGSYASILSAVASWNRERARHSHGAVAVKYSLNAINCDTVRAELLAADDMLEAA